MGEEGGKNKKKGWIAGVGGQSKGRTKQPTRKRGNRYRQATFVDYRGAKIRPSLQKLRFLQEGIQAGAPRGRKEEDKPVGSARKPLKAT